MMSATRGRGAQEKNEQRKTTEENKNKTMSKYRIICDEMLNNELRFHLKR